MGWNEMGKKERFVARRGVGSEDVDEDCRWDRRDDEKCVEPFGHCCLLCRLGSLARCGSEAGRSRPI